jgi:hypothetical protein
VRVDTARVNALALFLLVVSACAMRASVRIAVPRGVTVSDLTIELTPVNSTDAERTVDLVEVAAAEGERPPGLDVGSAERVVWSLHRRPGARSISVPSALRWNDLPDGYDFTGSRQTLPIGNYFAEVRAAGVFSRVEFHVNSSGRIE